ncbi:6-phosphofructokinase 5, chloroplastic [Dendrobium catenatum]|uniref:6-phosphofructokinase 5, chloroplastic n=1 Tax=Dendrobium catenatum TaxID=906689 RepID=A0A2I0XBU8_9ASPA|nr:6-phosphofructokinase 5, chloroplastic [Dendrobium catenatum]
MVSTSSISAVGLVNQHGLNWKADSSLFNLNYLSLIISGRNREFESTKFHIRALMAKPDIDFADPKWKNKFQESFDRRVPLVDGNGAPEDTWNGYVNDDDRALLKSRSATGGEEVGLEDFGFRERRHRWGEVFGLVEDWVGELLFAGGRKKSGFLHVGGESEELRRKKAVEVSRERESQRDPSPKASFSPRFNDAERSWERRATWEEVADVQRARPAGGVAVTKEEDRKRRAASGVTGVGKKTRGHRAGPRKLIYYEPDDVKAAIVTCGGLCPGLNDIIRQIVLTLEKYGVKKIVGIPFGYRGFFEEGLSEIPMLVFSRLYRRVVENINLAGGSLLGVSRGGGNISEIVDSIQCRKRSMKVSVIAVPKTIDNDIPLMDKTFGFDTAVEEAQRAINSAYIEAHSAYHGIGLVKLMGRSSGFIAMHASVSSGQIDVCLIPELYLCLKVPFTLEGPHGVLQHLEHLIRTKGSAVVCIAEGAGQSSYHIEPTFRWSVVINNRDSKATIFFGGLKILTVAARVAVILVLDMSVQGRTRKPNPIQVSAQRAYQHDSRDSRWSPCPAAGDSMTIPRKSKGEGLESWRSIVVDFRILIGPLLLLFSLNLGNPTENRQLFKTQKSENNLIKIFPSSYRMACLSTSYPKQPLDPLTLKENQIKQTLY